MPIRARRVISAIAAAGIIVLLPACHSSDDASAEANTHGFVPPTPVAAKPMPGQGQLTSLDAYLGHDPHDPIDGVEFFDRTDVSTALVAAVKDERVRKEFREGHGPARPIFAQGERIAAWGCAGEDCATRSWTFFLDRNTGKGEACFHEPKMGSTSHWYNGGIKPVVRGGGCPTS